MLFDCADVRFFPYTSPAGSGMSKNTKHKSLPPALRKARFTPPARLSIWFIMLIDVSEGLSRSQSDRRDAECHRCPYRHRPSLAICPVLSWARESPSSPVAWIEAFSFALCSHSNSFTLGQDELFVLFPYHCPGFLTSSFGTTLVDRYDAAPKSTLSYSLLKLSPPS